MQMYLYIVRVNYGLIREYLITSIEIIEDIKLLLHFNKRKCPKLISYNFLQVRSCHLSNQFIFCFITYEKSDIQKFRKCYVVEYVSTFFIFLVDEGRQSKQILRIFNVILRFPTLFQLYWYSILRPLLLQLSQWSVSTYAILTSASSPFNTRSHNIAKFC